MDLIFEHHAFWVIPALIYAILVATVLYFRNRTLPVSQTVRSLLFIFRAIVVLFTALLLLRPMVRTVFEQTEKPLFVILSDNSASMAATGDPEEQAALLNSGLIELRNHLEQKYQVAEYLFDEHVTEGEELTFDGAGTDIGSALKSVAGDLRNTNAAGIILISDGRTNLGTDPQAIIRNFPFPVFTLGTGDTSRIADSRIRQVAANPVVFEGDRFPVEVSVMAEDLKGFNSELTISKSGKEVIKQKVRFRSDHEAQTFSFLIDADTAGLQRYTIRLAPDTNEPNTINNTYELFVEVMKGRQKVLILAAAPHPDIGAIRRAVESDPNLEPEVAWIDEFKGNPEEYNVVILHSLPDASAASDELFQKLKQQKIPFWLFTTPQTRFDRLSNYVEGFRADPGAIMFNEALPLLSEDFTLFNFEKETWDFTRENLPPLIAPYGGIETGFGWQTLLTQKISGIPTGKPMLIFSGGTPEGSRSAILLGEGIWQWPMAMVQKNIDPQKFYHIVSRIIRYLSIREPKKRLRIEYDRELSESDEVIMRAWYFDRSYQPDNQPELKIVFQNEEGKEFSYYFSRTGQSYRLNAGHPGPGIYRFTATLNDQDEILTQSGSFAIKPVQWEHNVTQADWKLLYSIANTTGGRFYSRDQWDEMVQDLESLNHPDRLVTTSRLTDFLNIPWFFFILIALLTLEWGIRKYSGGY